MGHVGLVGKEDKKSIREGKALKYVGTIEIGEIDKINDTNVKRNTYK